MVGSFEPRLDQILIKRHPKIFLKKGRKNWKKSNVRVRRVDLQVESYRSLQKEEKRNGKKQSKDAKA